MKIRQKERDAFLHDLLFSIWWSNEYGDPDDEDIIINTFRIKEALTSPLPVVLGDISTLNIREELLSKGAFEHRVLNGIPCRIFIAIRILELLSNFYRPRKFKGMNIPNNAGFNRIKAHYYNITFILAQYESIKSLGSNKVLLEKRITELVNNRIQE